VLGGIGLALGLMSLRVRD
jgi:hypothetical protein